MQLGDFVNKPWSDPAGLNGQYAANRPFPHIVMRDFIRGTLLDDVETEFPDLARPSANQVEYADALQIKLASRGMAALSPAAFRLIGFLNSDLFLQYLQALTGIEETLISDPYLAGGGYHEIKRGGLLKIHADFNRHPGLDLDRRLNLLLYLNKDWSPDWGGNLELFDEDMSRPIVSVPPVFNTAVLFTTTSKTYHGHPDPLACPDDRSRKSIALYYFSTGRPEGETQGEHTTIFKERRGEKFAAANPWKKILKDCIPPIMIKTLRKLLGRA